MGSKTLLTPFSLTQIVMELQLLSTIICLDMIPTSQKPSEDTYLEPAFLSPSDAINNANSNFCAGMGQSRLSSLNLLLPGVLNPQDRHPINFPQPF
jgi:hypothetical protein